MISHVGVWLKSNIATYLDNATSRRDFRAQLRGNRSVILWASYLLLLIAIGMMNYSMSVERGQVSVVEAQSALQQFYQVVIGVLSAMVVLVAPALAATSVVAERERRSLDLVFSAPVKPKSFLVGKMISAYRYTWMLLILAIPITAVCVVMGGATWFDVLAAFMLLSLHGLLLSSMALLMSTLAQKAVSAIVWSYFVIGTYCVIATGLSATSVFSFGPGSGTLEMPFTAALSPIFIVQAAPTFTTVFGVEVPNWALFGVYALVVSRLMLLGAASAIMPYGAPETKNLRISILAYIGLLSALFAWSLGSAMGAVGPTGSNVDEAMASLLAWYPMVLLPALPFIACFGVDADRKYRPDGFFSWKAAIRGTPAGGLPFMLGLVACAAAGVMLTSWFDTGSAPGPITIATCVYLIGFWTFCWSLGRYASALNPELKAARTLHMAVLIMIFALPVPVLTLLDSERTTVLWMAYPLYPLTLEFVASIEPRIWYGIALAGLGILIAASAERRLGSRLKNKEATA